MKSVTRREAMRLAAAAGAGVVAASAAVAAEPAAKKPNVNNEPPVASQAKPESYGPREMFAVVDWEGKLKRGLHATSSRRLSMGAYVRQAILQRIRQDSAGVESGGK